MIFQHTWQWILHRSPHTGQRKTSTMRLASEGDVFDDSPHRAATVYRGGRAWLTVGREIAVQRSRGSKAIARIRITGIRLVTEPLAIEPSRIRAEGFADTRQWHEIWRKLHGKRCTQPAYAVSFELVSCVPNWRRRAMRDVAAGVAGGPINPKQKIDGVPAEVGIGEVA